MGKASTAETAPEAVDLRARAARARDAAGRFIKRAAPAETEALPAEHRQSEGAEPDPALAVVTVFRASWDALNKALDADAPDDLTAKLEDAQHAAYDRLRAVRPTTADGWRALAECWAMVLDGHRGNEPGMAAADHAADCLIAGAGAGASAEHVDWYDPPPGFMAWPAIEPSQFVPVSEGITLELARLRGAASAEFVRRMDARATPEGEARLRRELHLDLLSKAAPSDAGILGRVDLANARLVELRTIRENMYALSDVAYGLAAQECCRADRNGPLDSSYNAAGELMHWLADQFTAVEDHARVELQRRRPTDFWDRRMRLAAVAEHVIMNGDDAETASLISDLIAFAVEQAGH